MNRSTEWLRFWAVVCIAICGASILAPSGAGASSSQRARGPLVCDATTTHSACYTTSDTLDRFAHYEYCLGVGCITCVEVPNEECGLQSNWNQAN